MTHDSFYRCFRQAKLAVWVLMILLAASSCHRETTPVPSTTPVTTSEQSGPVSEERKTSDRLKLSPETVRYAKLEFAEAREELVVAPLEVTGRVAINDERAVRVGSLFSGRILDVSVNVGDRVRQGQTLARIHTHEVDEAQSAYVKARADMEQRKTEAERTESLLKRAERLFEAKAISLNELEKARVDHKAALQEVTRAEAEVQRTIGHREHLGLPDNLNYDEPVVVRTPSAGIVLKREITPGASVNPGDNLFFISDLSSIWVIAEVPEKNLSLLKVGAPLQIRVAAFPETSFAGKIARIGETLNAETRTVEVRCVAENRTGKLKPEMYARLALAVGDRRSALVIPQTALQEMDGQTVVFVSSEAGQFERRVVTTGQKQNDLIEITAGLSRGERIVTSGSFQIKSEFAKDKLREE